MTMENTPEAPHSIYYDFEDNNRVLNFYPMDYQPDEKPFRLSKIIDEKDLEDDTDNRF